MHEDTPPARPVVSTHVRLQGDGFAMSFQATVPAGPATVDDLLPLAQALSDVIVDETCRRAEASGEQVSCKRGCGACCRSFVAITQAEARQLQALVAAMPEPRRTTIEARFAQAQRRLDEAGLLALMASTPAWTSADYQAMVTMYFTLGIPCPFLEDESCSIYAARPITCREFLVTSPAQHCAELDSAEVRRLPLPLQVFHAVARWQAPAATDEGLEPWVPLIVAPAWAAAHPDTAPPKTGLELLKDLLARMQESA